MDLQRVVCEGMECINVAYYGDTWRVFVNAVMNIRVA
jgi:hypothetical protein